MEIIKELLERSILEDLAFIEKHGEEVWLAKLEYENAYYEQMGNTILSWYK